MKDVELEKAGSSARDASALEALGQPAGPGEAQFFATEVMVSFVPSNLNTTL